MGVELGKVLAKTILKQLPNEKDVTGHDSSVGVNCVEALAVEGVGA
jgi:glucose-6-phosphate isomerase